MNHAPMDPLRPRLGDVPQDIHTALCGVDTQVKALKLLAGIGLIRAAPAKCPNGHDWHASMCRTEMGLEVFWKCQKGVCQTNPSMYSIRQGYLTVSKLPYSKEVLILQGYLKKAAASTTAVSGAEGDSSVVRRLDQPGASF